MTNRSHSFRAITTLLTPIRAYDHRHWHPWPWLCAILAGLEAAMVDGTCSARDCKHEADMDFERDFDGEWDEDLYYEEA